MIHDFLTMICAAFFPSQVREKFCLQQNAAKTVYISTEFGVSVCQVLFPIMIRDLSASDNIDLLVDILILF